MGILQSLSFHKFALLKQGICCIGRVRMEHQLEIWVSHIIKGRTPEAFHKLVKDLLEEDKIISYERMMSCFEIPTIHEDFAGNRLNLILKGVRAYNHENLYCKKKHGEI